MNFQGEPKLPFGLNQMFSSGIKNFYRWAYVLLAAFLILVPLYFLMSLYTDYLWFSSLGFSSVFMTILFNKVMLFFVGAIVFGLFCTLSFYFSRKFSWGPVDVLMPESTFNFLKKTIIIGMAVFIVLASCVFGILIAKSWQTVLKFFNSSDYGLNEPILKTSIGFISF